MNDRLEWTNRYNVHKAELLKGAMTLQVAWSTEGYIISVHSGTVHRLPRPVDNLQTAKWMAVDYAWAILNDMLSRVNGELAALHAARDQEVEQLRVTAESEASDDR